MELSKTDQGRDRLDKTKDRLDAKTAEIMENMIDGPTTEKEVGIGIEPDVAIDEIPNDDVVQSPQGEISAEDDEMIDQEFEDGPRIGS